MKIRVLVSIPAYITEVEIHDDLKLDTDAKKQAYARDVALERTADKIREDGPWFDWSEMVAHILPQE